MNVRLAVEKSNREQKAVAVCLVAPADYEHIECVKEVNPNLVLNPMHFKSFEKISKAFYKMNQSRMQKFEGKSLQSQAHVAQVQRDNRLEKGDDSVFLFNQLPNYVDNDEDNIQESHLSTDLGQLGEIAESHVLLF